MAAARHYRNPAPGFGCIFTLFIFPCRQRLGSKMIVKAIPGKVLLEKTRNYVSKAIDLALTLWPAVLVPNTGVKLVLRLESPKSNLGSRLYFICATAPLWKCIIYEPPARHVAISFFTTWWQHHSGASHNRDPQEPDPSPPQVGCCR